MEASDLRSVTIAAIFSNKQGNAIFATLVMQKCKTVPSILTATPPISNNKDP